MRASLWKLKKTFYFRNIFTTKLKYRQLTYQEFDLMQMDFQEFLYKLGYSRFEWKVLQDQHSEYAINLLDKYSDQTFQKVMKDIHYLEFRKPKQLINYHCKEKNIEIIGLELSENSPIDFTQKQSISNLNQRQINVCRSFKKIRPYKKDREYEVFQLIESGRYVVNEHNFKLVKELRSSSEN